MVTLNSAYWALQLIALLAAGVRSTPAELDKRLKCNHDNCLNALLHNSGPAYSFCQVYLDNLYSTTQVPLSESRAKQSVANPLLARSATYTKPCTENPTAVSTACSCLLSIQATSTTSVHLATCLLLLRFLDLSPRLTTLSQTTALPTPTQCLASNNYGYKYAESAFDFKSQFIYFNEYSDSGKPGDCCIACYNTPSCYSFEENYGSVENDGSYSGYNCELGTVAGGTWPGVSKQCPLGIATGPSNGNFQAEPPGAPSGSALGPCGAA